MENLYNENDKILKKEALQDINNWKYVSKHELEELIILKRLYSKI